MDQIRRTSSLDCSIYQHVFRNEKVQEIHHSLGSPNNLGYDAGHLSFDQLRCRSSFSSNIDEERDDHDDNVPLIPTIAQYVQNECKDSGHECLIADSRDPEDDEIRIQRDARSNDDDERTAAHPMENDMYAISKRSSTEDDRFPRDFINNSASCLKRANPVYESESEAEFNICVQARKRRSMTVDGQVRPTPLYWTERLFVE
jgi:hypothetical protein